MTPPVDPTALLKQVADKINDAVGMLLTEDGVPSRDSELACDALEEAQVALSAARRSLASPVTPARTQCACAIPDPVMQADRRFYCHACSFQVPAVLCEQCQGIAVTPAIEGQEVIRLSPEAQAQLMAALDNPPEPSEALRRAIQRHREGQGHAATPLGFDSAEQSLFDTMVKSGHIPPAPSDGEPRAAEARAALDREALVKAIREGLMHAIADHGPITKEIAPSAEKRIAGRVWTLLRPAPVSEEP